MLISRLSLSQTAWPGCTGVQSNLDSSKLYDVAGDAMALAGVVYVVHGGGQAKYNRGNDYNQRGFCSSSCHWVYGLCTSKLHGVVT